MPAEIYATQAVYAKTPAWHRIGHVLEDCFSAEDALAILNPNRDRVMKFPASAVAPDGSLVSTEEYQAVVRKTPSGEWKILSFMSPDYTVVDIIDQFAWMDEIVKAVEGAHYTAAVELRGGRQTALTIDLGSVVLDPQERADIQHKFLFGANSYDGSWALKAKLANMRGECANMAAMILATHSPEYVTRHTPNVQSRVQFAQKALGLAVQYNDLFYVTAEELIHAPMSDKAFDRLLDDLFVVDGVTGEKDVNAQNQVRGVYELSPSQSKLYGTWWGGFNAVTEYNDWRTAVRGSKSNDVNQMRFLRQFDDTKGLKQRAWDYVVEKAEVVVG